MASTTDATYSPRVYREQGGENLIVASSGDLYVQSGGDLIIESGGTLQLDSGSSCTVATNLEMASGNYVARTVTTRTTATKATAIPLGSICAITATTGAPQYSLATPVAGAEIIVNLVAQTSNVGATVYTGSSGISVDGSSNNTLTLVGRGQTAHFFGASATAWHLLCNSTLAVSVKAT